MALEDVDCVRCGNNGTLRQLPLDVRLSLLRLSKLLLKTCIDFLLRGD